MKLSIEKIIKIYGAIETIKDREDLDFKFSYALVKNRTKLEVFIEAVKAMEKPSKLLTEFGTKRTKIAEKYADKSAKNKPGSIQLNPDHIADFEREVAPLLVEYKIPLEEAEKKNEEVREYLKEEEDVDLLQIEFSRFPEKLSVALVEHLSPLIKPEKGE